MKYFIQLIVIKKIHQYFEKHQNSIFSTKSTYQLHSTALNDFTKRLALLYFQVEFQSVNFAMTMATSRGFCKRDPDSFCYVSGTFISAKSVKHTIVEGNLFCEAFYAFFGVQVGDHVKAWVPHVVFGNCRSTLEAWYSVV